jgi:hypothetical protein
MRNGGLDPIAEVIEKDLVPSGLIREATAGLIRIVTYAPPPRQILAPIAALLKNDNVEPVVALARNALYYIAGAAPADEEHYQVPRVLGRMLSECNPSSVLTLAEVALSTHVPLGCTPLTEGCLLGTIALVDPLHALLSDERLREVLMEVSVGAIPEEGFVAVTRQFAAVLENPNFDFAVVRAMMRDVIYPYVRNVELKQKFENILDVLEQLTMPEVGLQASLAQTLVCMEAKDPDLNLVRMLYNLIAYPEFQLTELVSALSSSGELDPDESLARWVKQVIGLLKKEPATHQAILGLVSRLLEEKNARKIIPNLIAIKESGLVADLTMILDHGTNPCPDGKP